MIFTNQLKNRYGFTLMELLIVVIIIALLSAISFGYYKKSVEHSRFSEGLQTASAVSEAINRAYFDDQLEGRVSPVKRRKIKPDVTTADIGIANARECQGTSVNTDYCLKTRYFEVEVDEYGVVRAYRRSGAATTSMYYIQIQPSFARTNGSGNVPEQIACVAAQDAGKTFCETQGYTTCNDSGYCTKPI